MSCSRRWAPPAAVVLVGTLMAAVTWNRWVDPQVDFGRELYLAWRMSEGDELYRDLASFSGPLSPAINGLLFRLAGTGIHGLLALNGLILAVVTALSFRLLAQECGRWPAAMACAAFLAMCAFGHSSAYGIFNFMAPYSHELTHGVLVGVVGIALLDRARRSGRAVAFVGPGVCAGLSLLLKPEVALAIVGSLSLGVALIGSGDAAGRRRWPVLAAFASGVLAVPLGYVLVDAADGVVVAGTALVWPWKATLVEGARDVPLYRRMLGFDAPVLRIVHMVGWAMAWSAMIGGFASLARRLPPWLRDRPTIGHWSFAVAIQIASLLMVWGAVTTALSPLTLYLSVVGIALARRWWSADTIERRGRLAVSLAGVVFSVLYLAKLGIAPGVWDYGFALGAPGLMVAVATLLGPVPRWVGRDRGPTAVARGAAAALLCVVGAFHVAVSQVRSTQRSFPLGDGRDRVWVDEGRGRMLAAAVDDLDRRLPPSAATLLVLPEGVYVNYLLRRRTPAPLVNFMPVELALYRESELVDSLQASPPEGVLLFPKDTDREYGVEFGSTYGTELWDWVLGRYRKAATYDGADVLGRPLSMQYFVRRPP